MKKIYILTIALVLSHISLNAQNYDLSLMFRGVNSSTGNYQFALVATPDFEQTDPAPTADMGVAIYIPGGYTLGNFEAGNSGLQFFEWANSQENSYDGGTTDLVQLLRTDIVANNFTHSSAQLIELVIFDIISDMGNGNNPTTGEMILAENSDPNVTTNFYESFININLQDGNGTQDYFGVHDPASNSINFETLTIASNVLDLDAIAIFPNPATSIVHIRSDFQIDSYELYDIMGKRILVSNKDQFNVEGLNAGVYLLKIKVQNRQVIKKIIVE